MTAPVYPDTPAERDRWIVSRRGARNSVRADRPHVFFLEKERSASGKVESNLTILLTNRECPWRCLMCDLWKNTLEEPVPVGAIPSQIDHALAELRPDPGVADSRRPTQLKLYNSGSFFDSGAIPPEDYRAIAERASAFERVIVECHPALVKDRLLAFRDLLGQGTELEIAMGLETAHPGVLEKLNKRMTLDQFARAALWLRENKIALRSFVLVKPPFLDEAEALHWAKRSVDFAFDCEAAVVSLIPTRAGNGAIETLAPAGLFSPPRLDTLEAALDYGVRAGQGRVFADLWDLERIKSCLACFDDRSERLNQINLTQSIAARVMCNHCGGDA